MSAQIERTREELAETLDALSDRVAPRKAAKRTPKSVSEGTGETVAPVTDTGPAQGPDAVLTPPTKVLGAPLPAVPATAPGPAPVAAPTPRPVAPPAPALRAVAPPLSAPGGADESLFRKPIVAAGVAAALVILAVRRRRRRRS